GVVLQRLVARGGVETLVLQRVRQLVNDDRLPERGRIGDARQGLRKLPDGEIRVRARVVEREDLGVVHLEHLAQNVVRGAVDELQVLEHADVIVERVRDLFRELFARSEE